MDTRSLIQIPGYQYNEYLLILNPHEELRNKIMQVKKEFGEKYKAPIALPSPKFQYLFTIGAKDNEES